MVMMHSYGGIVGLVNSGNILNVYNSGNISVYSKSQRIMVGGIVGIANNGELINSYNLGTITNVNQSSIYRMGEIEGVIQGEASVSNSFYLNNQPIGINYSSSLCVTTQVSRDDLKGDNVLNILNQNGIVWKKDTTNVNNGYPIFTWQ